MVQGLTTENMQNTLVPRIQSALNTYTLKEYFGLLDDKRIENSLRELGLVQLGDTISVAKKFGFLGLESLTVTIKDPTGRVKVSATIENGKVTKIMVA